MSTQKMQDQFNEIVKKVDQLESQLNVVRRALNNFDKEHLQVDYSQVDGVIGEFDGMAMITKEGERYEVPANYAAKSKLVYGDVLKLIEEDGKKLFKQIERVNRKKVEGILTKKEGEWYMLTDRGAYRVSDAAAEYQNAVLNAEVTAYLPEDNPDAPFATIDVVVVEKKPLPAESPVKESKETKSKETKSEEKKTPKKAEQKTEKKPRKKRSKKPQPKDEGKKEVKKEEKPQEKASSGGKKILAEDDLV